MINQNYYQNHIKKFPEQFAEGIKRASAIPLQKNVSGISICGVGGSAWYGDIINNVLRTNEATKLKIDIIRSYHLPPSASKNTLYIVSSYSGNTEETISCLQDILQRKMPCCIFTSGGKLLQIAKENNLPLYQLPTGIQPRLSTGYFIAGILTIAERMSLIPSYENELFEIATQLEQNINQKEAQLLALELKNKVPIVYATDNVSSIAKVAKIKFNENSKIQSFHNEFPELNHNEMVGFTNLIMNPYILILQSQWTHQRNKIRAKVFQELMESRGIPVKIINLIGKDILAELLNAYYFIEHVSYYLAQEYGTDPEPVEMVEEFKKRIEKL